MQAWNWDANHAQAQVAAASSYASAQGYQPGTNVAQPTLGQAPLGYQQYYGNALSTGTPDLAQQQLEQQQHWQQWQQWQQQYQQWQLEYGDQYKASLNTIAMQGPAPPLASVAQPPPLPPPDKPPPPPVEDNRSEGFQAQKRQQEDYSSDANKKPRYPNDAPAWRGRAGGGSVGGAGRFNAPSGGEVEKPAEPKKETLDELSEAEKAFDLQFKQWEEQFSEWKAQNINHPDKNQYREYEAKWRDWREKLLQRRVQMKKKREASTIAAKPLEQLPPGPVNTGRADQRPNDQYPNNQRTLDQHKNDEGGQNQWAKDQYGNDNHGTDHQREGLHQGGNVPGGFRAQQDVCETPKTEIKSLMDIPLGFMAQQAKVLLGQPKPDGQKDEETKVPPQNCPPKAGQFVAQPSKINYNRPQQERNQANFGKNNRNVMNFPKTFQISSDISKAIEGTKGPPDSKQTGKQEESSVLIGPELPPQIEAAPKDAPEVIDIAEEKKKSPNYDFLKKSTDGIPGLDMFNDKPLFGDNKGCDTPNSNSQNSSMRFGQDSSTSQDNMHFNLGPGVQTSQGQGFQFPKVQAGPKRDLPQDEEAQDVARSDEPFANEDAQHEFSGSREAVEQSSVSAENRPLNFGAGNQMPKFSNNGNPAPNFPVGQGPIQAPNFNSGNQGSNFSPIKSSQSPNANPLNRGQNFNPGNQNLHLKPGNQAQQFGPSIQGPNFNSGNQGRNFQPGSQGPNLIPGNQGPNFNPGNQGLNFNSGNQGPNINTGNQGPNFKSGHQSTNLNPGNLGQNLNPGNQGPNFNSGNQGPNFNPGNQGPNFNSGNQGPNFNSGNQGPNFNSGNQGPNFNSGNQGPNLNPGNQGPTFKTGNQGPNFNPGNQGPNFNPGNQGPNLNPGNQGPNLNSGNQGPNFNPGNQGPNFNPGNQGPNFNPGNQGPNFNNGNQGINLKPGNQGPNFNPGNQGPNLNPGNQGPNYNPGNQGPNLNPGNQGPNFNPGNQGPNFNTGNQGSNLNPGNQGPNFNPGNQGPYFKSGNQGPNLNPRIQGSNVNSGNPASLFAPLKQASNLDLGSHGPGFSPANNLARLLPGTGTGHFGVAGNPNNGPKNQNPNFRQGNQAPNFGSSNEENQFVINRGPDQHGVRDGVDQQGWNQQDSSQDSGPNPWNDNNTQWSQGGPLSDYKPGSVSGNFPGQRDFNMPNQGPQMKGNRPGGNYPPPLLQGNRDIFPLDGKGNFPGSGNQLPRENFSDIVPRGPPDNFQGPRDIFPPGPRNNFPQNQRDNFQQSPREQYPPGPRDNFSQGFRDNFPAGSRENFPLTSRDNFFPGPRDDLQQDLRGTSSRDGPASQQPREPFPRPRDINARDDFPGGDMRRELGGQRDSRQFDDFSQKRVFSDVDRERGWDQESHHRGQLEGRDNGPYRSQPYQRRDSAFELEPATIVEYGHKPASVISDVDRVPVLAPAPFLAPVQTFDYGHGAASARHSRDPSPPKHSEPWYRDGEEPYYRGRDRDSSRDRSGLHGGGGGNRYERGRRDEEPPRKQDYDDDRFRSDRTNRRSDGDSERDRDRRYRDSRRDDSGRNGSKSAGPHGAPPPPTFSSSKEVEKAEAVKAAAAKASSTQRPILIEDLLSPPGRSTRPTRIVVILRGPPGSGKTFVARLIKDKEVENGGSPPRILCLDDYFIVEVEKEKTDEETGRKTKVKVMEYEYEAAMEKNYRSSLMKAFRKTINDNYFPFIIVDCVNQELKHFDDMWSYAKQKGFQTYVCEMDQDLASCVKRNVHHRTESEISVMIANWQPVPSYYLLLDVRSLLQSVAITEVEMEDSTPDDGDPSTEEKTEKPATQDEDSDIISKWERMEPPSGEKLDRMDGLKRRKEKTLEDWLTATDDYENRTSLPGKKRVRWADLEEKRNQEKMRAIGFVVGQTDWSRMTDPTCGESALTQTKYI